MKGAQEHRMQVNIYTKKTARELNKAAAKDVHNKQKLSRMYLYIS